MFFQEPDLHFLPENIGQPMFDNCSFPARYIPVPQCVSPPSIRTRPIKINQISVIIRIHQYVSRMQVHMQDSVLNQPVNPLGDRFDQRYGPL